ncbi:fructose-bisphosphate aldolase-like [Macrosteles quadrilineatus]|uniref:fructose-bisphosphate aldolase-like n=1 Tax=Macrosteles quadrilineatus TaxID=74068 RepID=UPI0023E14052|nr:fructose-bisphosphate aldolase-like [Macrosteles quadrilineatus]
MSFHCSTISTIYHYLPDETQKELRIITKTLLAPGKGILAADESVSSIGRKLKDINLENSEENRRKYRKLLFSTENLGEYISGVVCFHETLFQKADDEETLLIDLLREKRIIPGIKVDKGVVPLYGTEDECTTQGIDDLGPRCEQYKKIGCHFAKWRCVFKIGQRTPSDLAIRENANTIARYASVCQAYRIVPIIEPEILADGNHTLLRCQKVTEKVLSAVFKALSDHDVFLEGLILKTNMITQGQMSKDKFSPEEIAEATTVTLQRTVPPIVAGIAFLSGGQYQDEATINLNAINKFANQTSLCKPWPLTFCYGRALQTSVLQVWGGNEHKVVQAQEELMIRAKANAEASLGQYIRSSQTEDQQGEEPETVVNN